MKWLRFWEFSRERPDPEPVELIEEARQAKEEAIARREQTLAVIRNRERIKRRNHIADDIGRAYQIIQEGRG